MTISIITATFNSGATLRDTFESVLSQTFKDIEYIVIDGKSEDNTLDIIREYEQKFHGKMRWISEQDNGIYDAMNKGIAMSTGDVIGILNSDDFYADSNVLQVISSGFDSVDAVYGDLDFVNVYSTDKIVRKWKGSQYKSGAFFNGWHPAHPTFYVRKKCYNELGGFDTVFDVSADFELMLRFIEKAQIPNKYIPYTFVKMRIGGESTGSIGKIILGNKNVLKAFKKNGFHITPFYTVKRLLPKVINVIKIKFHI